MPEEKYKGIVCPNPNCKAIDKYKGGQNIKSQDKIVRIKECKICGTKFKTIEVFIGIKEINNNN